LWESKENILQTNKLIERLVYLINIEIIICFMNSDNTYDLESWEGDYELYEEEDWVALFNLREKDAKKHPSDLYAQQRYAEALNLNKSCLLYTSPSPRDVEESRMPSSA